MVRERFHADGGAIVATELRHRIVLSAVHADMPERQYLARWPGAKAQLPCGYCRIQGTLHGRQYVPQGYTVAVKHDLLVSPTRTLMADAEELWIDDECVLIICISLVTETCLIPAMRMCLHQTAPAWEAYLPHRAVAESCCRV